MNTCTPASIEWRIAVQSLKQDPSPTQRMCNQWVKMAISQLRKVTEGAWHERNQALHNGQNNLISQSEYDEKKQKKLYQHKEEISTRDEHLFGNPLNDLLKSRLGKKTRFLERAKHLFADSKAWAEKGQKSISSHYHQISPVTTQTKKQQQEVGKYRKSFTNSTLTIQFSG